MDNLLSTFNFQRGKQITGIYMLKINEHVYIGSSNHIKRRLRNHRTRMKNNKHDNKYLQHAYNKYKVCTYCILEQTDNSICKTDLALKELNWITKLKADLNIDSPLNGMGLRKGKPVYQYTLTGSFIKEYSSAEITQIDGFNPDCVRSCANPNAITKSHLKYIWSYEKTPVSYINNNGKRLRKGVIMYDVMGTELQRFDSLSDAARNLCKEENRNYVTIRSMICAILKGRGRIKRLYGKYIFTYLDEN
jgi:predicted GIY-YIG superfamily endonuclease